MGRWAGVGKPKSDGNGSGSISSLQLFVRKGQFHASQGSMKKETNKQSAEIQLKKPLLSIIQAHFLKKRGHCRPRQSSTSMTWLGPCWSGLSWYISGLNNTTEPYNSVMLSDYCETFLQACACERKSNRIRVEGDGATQPSFYSDSTILNIDNNRGI